MPKPNITMMPAQTSRQSAPAHSILALTGFFLICYAVAGLGAIVTIPSIPTWYAALAKPGFNPPDGLFGPVWTALYGLMAVAGWLVWRARRGPGEASAKHISIRREALVLFAGQLLLNALWSPLFFGLHRVLGALAVILLLWIAILLTMLRFYRVDRFAAALMVPYLCWVGFAAALNYSIYRLN